MNDGIQTEASTQTPACGNQAAFNRTELQTVAKLLDEGNYEIQRGDVGIAITKKLTPAQAHAAEQIRMRSGHNTAGMERLREAVEPLDPYDMRDQNDQTGSR